MIWPACDWVLCLCLTSYKSWQARCFQETRRQFVSFPVLIIKGGKRNLDQIILLSHYLSSHQPIVHQITQGCHFIEASSAIIANSLLGRKSLSRLLEGSGAALLESQGVLRCCFFPFLPTWFSTTFHKLDRACKAHFLQGKFLLWITTTSYQVHDEDVFHQVEI